MTRKQDDVKIQINSLEALERLIGGDSELEIDIRRSVVANFTKKYLSDIAKEENIQAMAQKIHDDAVGRARDEAAKKILTKTKTGWRRGETVLTAEMQKQVDAAVQSAVGAIAAKVVVEKLETYVEEWMKARKLEKWLECAIERIYNSKLCDMVKKKTEKSAKELLQKMGADT